MRRASGVLATLGPVASVVLHADADAFLASVAQRSRPDLAALPFGVTAFVFVASANYVARRRGVRGGMLAEEALRLCPDLILLEPPRADAEEASDALFDLFNDCCAAVQPGSMEEAFLDVGAADYDSARTAGDEIRRRAAAELGLPISIGVGRTKMMAKLASRAAKPDGLYAIDREEEDRIRVTLPLTDAWGVGARTIERLAQRGVTRLGDLDALPREELELTCGAMMARRLRGFRDGTDDAVVRPMEGRTMLSAEGAISGFRRPDHTPADLLDAAVARVCRRAQRAGLVGTDIALTLRVASGGSPIVRRQAFADPSADAGLWRSRARALLAQDSHPPLSGLGVSLTKLRPTDQVPPTLF